MTTVTVYIAAYNYGHYIDDAVESVVAQTMIDWELIIINDGSTDNTKDVLKKFDSNPKIKIIDQENKGLNRTNNIALRLSSGKYIMRLDADDYLDENALLILSNTLDAKEDIDLVYPDYYLIDHEGKVLDLVRRKKIDDEVRLLDLPAHGACTMYRTHVLRQIGGYMEEFTCQDGYEMWLRFIQKHKPYNVNIPLFYYRQHPVSLTKNEKKILSTRREIKRQYVNNVFNGEVLKVLAVIPATRQSISNKNDPLVELAGEPLLLHTIREAAESKLIDKIVVSSEDPEVLKYAEQFQNIVSLPRDIELASPTSKLEDLIEGILKTMKDGHGYEPDAVCCLYINTPLRKSHHIDWAVDTMMIYDVDTVISVQEELAPCYQHRKFGLEPINDTSRGMRIERDAVYKENGAILLSRSDVFNNGNVIGKKVSHITMLPEESIKINSEYEYWLAGQVLENWH